MQKIPFLLPHELILTIFAHVHERVLNKDGIDPHDRNEVEASCHSLGVDAADVVPLGFGLDGVESKWDDELLWVRWRMEGLAAICVLHRPGVHREA